MTQEQQTILIKLSGESLSSGSEKYSEKVLEDIAGHVARLLEDGVRVALVVGAGNLFRGRDLAGDLGIERSTADYIGMLGTVQNALVVRDFFESKGVSTRVLSSINMPQLCEPYIPRRGARHLEKGRVIIFAAGLGVPYFTTDTTSVQRALEIGANMLVMAKHGVDGLYTADPKVDPNATKIDRITSGEVLEKGLRVADAAAIALAQEHGLTLRIVSLDDLGRVFEEGVGSYVTP